MDAWFGEPARSKLGDMLRTLTALLVAATTAGLLAGPAAAAPNDAPVDSDGKKSCKALASGGVFWLSHGSRVTVTYTDAETGKKTKQTLRCDDGTWTSEMLRPTRPTRPTAGTVRADGLPVLQAVPAAARIAPRLGSR